MSELLTIEGIDSDEVELLEATGWTDLNAVARANVDVLLREVTKANDMLRIVARAPERKKVERWVASAAKLLDHPRGGRAKAAESVKPTVTVVEEGGAPALSLVVDESEEVLPVPLAGPVNFEADPEVLVMLAAAPVAVPIPARMLAEQGISPSEIAIAPVLNRAEGDLDVRVAVMPSADSPHEAHIPDAPQGSRRVQSSSSVQLGDATAPIGRRGIDPSRVRTIEEAQGDVPPPRASSSRAGMEDERIALLRSPRPETNKGRNPNSRFFIRGVLHDQPLKVWFGGLFAVLLQISIPLAIIAAPLLILHDEKPEQFAWVPKWIIAFPLAVPILGLLYALVSARAKCRVCAQRIYVPKHCLKNRKAHHLPMLGFIGALALHVITFKWFNCTFCGTSIRIKK
ncbi:DUF4332 domain-containing protein [Haloferula sp. BvORR071]|uniref:DUF4332 domain-containing protein n=1 Tax=Haloferula sp. BvORR071 TaxID=1396141 RepID=UPI000556B481|nr:DUF4332 domain-containing protein [Haloferula sp. BvORR071]